MAATPTIAIKGLRKCGIVPMNDVFSDHDFAAAATTETATPQTLEQEITMEEENLPVPSVSPSTSRDSSTLGVPGGSENPNTTFVLLSKPISTVQPQINRNAESAPSDNMTQTTSTAKFDPSIPSTSSASRDGSYTPNSSSTDLQSKTLSPNSNSQSAFAVSPRDIVPLPKSNIAKKQNKRKKGTAAVLTSSPYKANLIAKRKKKIINIWQKYKD